MCTTYIPTLHQASSFSLTVTAWNTALRNSSATLPVSTSSQWNWIKESARKIIDAVPVPNILKKDSARYVSVVEEETKEWMKTHGHPSIPTESWTRNSRWSTMGLISGIKTSEALVADGSLCASLRYRLACEFCLVDRIPLLWENMSEGEKENFCADVKSDNLLLPLYWMKIVHGCNVLSYFKLDRAYEIYLLYPDYPSVLQRIFAYCFRMGYEEATKYFLREIFSSEEERRTFLLNAKRYIDENFDGQFSKCCRLVGHIFDHLEEPQQDNFQSIMFFINWKGRRTFFLEEPEVPPDPSNETHIYAQ